MGEVAVSLAGDTVDWLTTASHWTGQDGVLHRLGEHLAITGASVGAAAALALPLGVYLGHRRRGALLVVSIANAARAVPTFGVLVLLALGSLGIGTAPAVVALVIFAIPPMLTNAYTGVREVDADARDAARGLGMSGGQLLRRVELPLALPLVMAGIRTATVQVVATATLAAIVGSGGLGRFIVDGYGRQDYPMVYGGVVIVAALAVVAEVVLGWVQRRLTPGRAAAVEVALQPTPA